MKRIIDAHSKQYRVGNDVWVVVSRPARTMEHQKDTPMLFVGTCWVRISRQDACKLLRKEAA